MSATRDPSEKVSFLFTPVGKVVERNHEKRAPSRGRVLKSSNLREIAHRPGLVREHRSRQIPKSSPSVLPSAIPSSLALQLQSSDLRLQQQRQALSQLRQNLTEFQNLQKRFQFILLELEELLKD